MSTDERRSTSAKRRNIVNPEEDKKAAAAAERARQALKKRKKTSFWDQYSYHIIIGGFIFIIAVTILSTLFGKTKKLSLTPVIELDEIETHNQGGYGYKLGANSFFQVTINVMHNNKHIFNRIKLLLMPKKFSTTSFHINNLYQDAHPLMKTLS